MLGLSQVRSNRGWTVTVTAHTLVSVSRYSGMALLRANEGEGHARRTSCSRALHTPRKSTRIHRLLRLACIRYTTGVVRPVGHH